MLEIHEPDAGFGVTRIDGLGPTGNDAHAETLRELLARHAVVCLSMPRALTDDELQDVARLFGPIKDPVAPTRDGGELRYSEPRQVIDSGFVMTDEIREKLGDLQFGGLDDDRPGLFETYHCDDTFTAEPASATVLHARALPPGGGGPTWFLDMRAALARLDEPTRSRIATRRVIYAHNNQDAFPPRRSANGPADALEEVRHPLVRTHARAGTQALFLDLDRALGVEGMPLAEGRTLLQRLQDHAEAEAPECAHTWRAHDVLAWDNASVQHKAGGDFAVGEPRKFWRYMIAGDRPA